MILAFWGINIAAEAAREVADLVESIKESMGEESSLVTFEHPDDYHLTLKFLAHQAPELDEPMAQLLTRYAAELTPFSFTLQTVGMFARRGRGGVLYLGVDENARDPLRQWAEEIDHLCFGLGLSRESRPFVPHVTFGRADRLTDLSKARLETFCDWSGLTPVRVTRFDYMKRRKGRAVGEKLYESFHTAALGNLPDLAKQTKG